MERVFCGDQDPNGPKREESFNHLSLKAKLALLFGRKAVSSEGGSEFGALHVLMGIIQASPDTLASVLAPSTPDDLREVILPLVRRERSTLRLRNCHSAAGCAP